MRSIAIGLAAMLVAATAADAMPSYQNTRMSCDSVHSAIRSHGAVMLRWQSRRVQNLPLFGKYVSSPAYCEVDETTGFASVPSRDDPTCSVLKCVPRETMHMRRLFRPFHHHR